MTNAQTEARAIAERLMLPDEDVFNLAVDIIATALAAKDAELVKIDAHRRKVIAENERLLNAIIDRDRKLTEANKALEQIVALDEAMGHELTVKHAFEAIEIARRALEAQGEK